MPIGDQQQENAHEPDKLARWDVKRSELYALVWSSPISQISKTLNLSDVGLAKICVRHSIPVPARGYWAKRKAGYKGRQPPLPRQEQDLEIHFPQTAKASSARSKGGLMIGEHLPHPNVQIETPVVLPDDINRAHKLVALTASYCKRLPSIIARYERTRTSPRSTPNFDLPPQEGYGRLSYHRAEGLNVTASLDAMDWVLRFHHGVFTALATHGVVFRRERPKDYGPVHVIADLNGEKLNISFSQGYSRQLPELKRRSLDLRSTITGESSPRYSAVDRMNFKV